MASHQIVVGIFLAWLKWWTDQNLQTRNRTMAKNGQIFPFSQDLLTIRQTYIMYITLTCTLTFTQPSVVVIFQPVGGWVGVSAIFSPTHSQIMLAGRQLKFNLPWRATEDADNLIIVAYCTFLFFVFSWTCPCPACCYCLLEAIFCVFG